MNVKLYYPNPYDIDYQVTLDYPTSHSTTSVARGVSEAHADGSPGEEIYTGGIVRTIHLSWDFLTEGTGCTTKVTNYTIGTGDGSTTEFDLTGTNSNTIWEKIRIRIADADISKTDYRLSKGTGTGVLDEIIFDTAPASGTIKADYEYFSGVTEMVNFKGIIDFYENVVGNSELFYFEDENGDYHRCKVLDIDYDLANHNNVNSVTLTLMESLG